MYKDILNHTWAPEETGKNFKKIRVDPHYYSWSTAVADFNHDGKHGRRRRRLLLPRPRLQVGKQIYTPVSFNPTSEWPIPAMVNIAYDFTGDGWADVLQMGGNAGNGTGYLFVNPKGQSRHWPKYHDDSAGRQRRDALQGHRRRRPPGSDPRRHEPAALLDVRSEEVGSGESDRDVDHARRLRAGTMGRQHRPRPGCRRHQRRRPRWIS